MARRKPYFAQTSCGESHRSKHFDTIEEARVWLLGNGGGTIKKCHAQIIHASGYGLGRVVFDPPLRVWGEIEEVENV